MLTCALYMLYVINNVTTFKRYKMVSSMPDEYVAVYHIAV